jgi:hypothetical protein
MAHTLQTHTRPHHLCRSVIRIFYENGGSRSSDLDRGQSAKRLPLGHHCAAAICTTAHCSAPPLSTSKRMLPSPQMSGPLLFVFHDYMSNCSGLQPHLAADAVVVRVVAQQAQEDDAEGVAGAGHQRAWRKSDQTSGLRSGTHIDTCCNALHRVVPAEADALPHCPGTP